MFWLMPTKLWPISKIGASSPFACQSWLQVLATSGQDRPTSGPNPPMLAESQGNDSTAFWPTTVEQTRLFDHCAPVPGVYFSSPRIESAYSVLCDHASNPIFLAHQVSNPTRNRPEFGPNSVNIGPAPKLVKIGLNLVSFGPTKVKLSTLGRTPPQSVELAQNSVERDHKLAEFGRSKPTELGGVLVEAAP